MDNTASQPSCISRPASTSAGESSWAMHFACFVQASSVRGDLQEMDLPAGVSDSDSSFSSSFDSLGGDGDDEDSFITSDMVCNDDDEDDSLQDTACSSAAHPKVTRMNDVCMKSMVTMEAKDMSAPQLCVPEMLEAKYFVDASSRQWATGAVREVIGGGNNKETHLHECNDLRKRGLCLVPLSMLIDYLG